MFEQIISVYQVYQFKSLKYRKKLSISEPFTIKVVSNSVNTAKKNASITSKEYSE